MKRQRRHATERRLGWLGRALGVSLLGGVLAACQDMPTEVPIVESPVEAAFAAASAETGETIATDKDDYLPGDTVRVTGSGWSPGDSVDLVLTEDSAIHDPVSWTVGVDASGAFESEPYVVEDHDVGVTFTLTATSRATSATVSVTFYDCHRGCYLWRLNLTGTRSAAVEFHEHAGPACAVEIRRRGRFTITERFRRIIFAPFGGGSGSATAAATSDQGATFSHWKHVAGRAATVNGRVLCIPRSSFFSVYTAVYLSNSPPVANAGGPYSGDEGSAIALGGATATDPDGDALTLSWAVDTSPTAATCTFSDASALNPDLTCDDNGSFTVTLTADDGTAPAVSSDATVTVHNVAPAVGAVTVPTDPIDISNQPVTGVSAPYSDPGTADTHTCAVDYGDGSGLHAGTAAAGTCTGPGHSYSEAGVYTVTVEVTDDDGDSGDATSEAMIVIYDPDGGFVTGGGWFNSPAGAFKADESLTGKANFGFVAKYKKGASVPTGNTEFQFKAGDLNFHSSSYEWLVVNQNGENAQFKGEGTINGAGVYKFMLWAGDKNPDTFRIQITEVGGGIVYDNGIDQEIDGGSIVIHTK